MCNVKEYNKIFHKIEKLSPEDTLQIILESENEEEKNFYEMIGDYLLQKKQREIVERNLF